MHSKIHTEYTNVYLPPGWNIEYRLMVRQGSIMLVLLQFDTDFPAFL